jgi:hypothetical protein
MTLKTQNNSHPGPQTAFFRNVSCGRKLCEVESQLRVAALRKNLTVGARSSLISIADTSPDHPWEGKENAPKILGRLN